MLDAYTLSIAGLLVLCLLQVGLAGISGPMKGKAGVTGGPVAGRDEASLLFRVDRAHMNTVESLTPFAVPAVLAMLAGMAPAFLAGLVWVFVVSRVAHSLVYLRGGRAARGGGLRTALYVVGAMSNLVLIFALGVHVLG